MRHRLLVISLVAAAALTAVAAATAGTLTATATVSGTAGISLGMPSTASLSDTLTGDDQTVTYAPALLVADARGSGGGWNLTISSTNFDDGAGHTLAPGAVSAVSSSCHSGSSCTAASNSVTYPLTISGSAAKFFSVAAGSGLGKLDVSPTVSVTIPGNAYAGTYNATVTLAAATGP